MKQILFTIVSVLVLSISAFAQTEKMPCPTIKVVGGGVVKPGESMSFSVKVDDDAKDLKLEYEWTVSQGTISGGQGTASITVDTTELSAQNVTAEVKIKGLSENCANNSSETGSVDQEPPVELLDEYGNLPDNEVKARVDSLFFYLRDLPTYYGYIINYGTDKEIANRERQIRRAIDFRKYDASRIKMIRGGANPTRGVWTKVWTFPPDFKRIPVP